MDTRWIKIRVGPHREEPPSLSAVINEAFGRGDTRPKVRTQSLIGTKSSEDSYAGLCQARLGFQYGHLILHDLVYQGHVLNLHYHVLNKTLKQDTRVKICKLFQLLTFRINTLRHNSELPWFNFRKNNIAI